MSLIGAMFQHSGRLAPVLILRLLMAAAFICSSGADFNCAAADARDFGTKASSDFQGVSQLSLNAPKKGAESQPVNSSYTLEKFLLEMTNQERTKKRLKPLLSYTAMNELAVKHSSDMCNAKQLVHESDLFPAGRKRFDERMRGIGLNAGAENIAYHSYFADNKGLARKIVDGWMNSSRHRSNILNEKFAYVGFGSAVCKDGLVYVTQLFTDKKAGNK